MGAAALTSFAHTQLAKLERASQLQHEVAQLTHRDAHEIKRRMRAVPKTDTACTSPADCRLKELFANKCNYGRAALSDAYNAVNVGAHVMVCSCRSCAAVCMCNHGQFVC